MNVASLDVLLAPGWAEAVALGAKAGLDGLEPYFAAGVEDTDAWSPDGHDSMRRAALDAGMKVPSITLGALADTPPVDPDPDKGQRGRRLIDWGIETAQALDASVILVPVLSGDLNRGDALARWTEELRRVAPAAESAGVTLACENCCQAFGSGLEDLVSLKEAVGSPAVGIYYDPHNAAASGFDPLREIERWGAHITQLHVKNGPQTLLDQGPLNWPELLCALRKNYGTEWLVLECHPAGDPLTFARDNLALLTGWLRQIGWC